MTWLLIAAFSVAAFFFGRAWQAVRTERRIDFYIDEIESGIDLIVRQQQLIREQRTQIDTITREWQASHDRLVERGLA